MLNNALLNDVFLNELFHQQERQIYARITVLTQDEHAIESIEGKVSGGSINIDGDSVVRRSCSINLIASQDLNINEFYWGFKNKFKLEIGLSNKIDNNYDEVIWFPQGIFLITNFDCSYTTNKYDISIKGKDKMCLLNGEMGGAFPHTIKFHEEEYHDLETDTITYTDIPIKTIIQEMMKNYGNESPQNIIINDMEDAGLELLEYRGNTPMFLLRPEESDVFENITFNEKQECYYLDNALKLRKTVIGDSKNIIYDNLVSLEGEKQPSKIVLTMLKHESLSEEDFNLGVYYKMHKQFFINKDKKYFIDNEDNYFISDNTIFEYANIYEPNEIYYSVGKYYYIAKFDVGSAPGYRLTDLTYAGELIANAGDNVTSILDKIKTMLGDFEYFYNLDGKFVFQKRQRYNSSNWYNAEMDEVIYNDAILNMNKPIFSFLDNELITSFKNTPKMDNMKNDYSVWGTRKLDSGTERQIHARYAIDIKPKFYKSYAGHFYITEQSYIEDIQENLNNTNLTKFTPMIEVGLISEEEFKTGIYYKRNLFHLNDFNTFLHNLSEPISLGKYYAILKDYVYSKEYDSNAFYYQPVDEFIHIVDWREIIYQMALDYRKYYHNTDFLYNIAQNNKKFYPTGITGYERYYTDLEGFWRDLYNPNPEPISEYVSAKDAINYHDNDNLYVTNSFRKLNDKEKDQFLIDLSQLYILDYSYEIKNDTMIHSTPEITPFLGSKYCHLNYNANQTKSSETYFYPKENGVMNNGTDDINELNQIPLNDIYIKERGPFITLERYNDETGVEERNYYYVKGKVQPGQEFPEINNGQESEEDKEKVILNYDELQLLHDKDMLPFYGADNQWFLIQKIITSGTPYAMKPYGATPASAASRTYATYQYWVYKYPFGTKLGEYPDDYSNYVAKEFASYLNEYGWDNLYIKDSAPIKFSELEQPIQRLYYKQTQRLTEYLRILQYDNFNQLKTNFTELQSALLSINISDYSSLDLFNSYIENVIKEYVGEYSVEAKNKSEVIYNIKKLNTETEKEYLKRVETAFKDYIKWFQEQYPAQMQKPYYIEESVQYQTVHYDYNINTSSGDYWNKYITEAPETLDFWFDFINGETSFLSKYSIQTIGPRPKVINDTTVKAIYYKEVPNIIFITSQEEKEKYDIQTGYNYIQLPQEMQSIFVVSSRGKSATNAIEDLIYQHCYASETASISTVPVYHLQPNTCIYIENDNTNINGDYLISKISIPLEAKKQMNITATKVIPSIL